MTGLAALLRSGLVGLAIAAISVAIVILASHRADREPTRGDLFPAAPPRSL